MAAPAAENASLPPDAAAAQQAQDKTAVGGAKDAAPTQPDAMQEAQEAAVPAGPWLQYLGQAGGQWRSSCLILLPPAKVNVPPPLLTFSADGGPPSRLTARLLDEHADWRFWRFDLVVTMTGAEQAVEYWVDYHDPSQEPMKYTVYVPGVQQPMHWAFHSCNGLSVNTDVSLWGEPLLWRDVFRRHRAEHLHAVVGGGDQIYNDGFWKTAPFQAWLNIPEDKDRLEHPFSLDMEQTLASWLLHHYRLHYSHPDLKRVFACVPQVNQKDDHDVFDGWGSYPDELQACPVFQGAYAVLDRFYLLFQQHTTPEGAEADNDLFGPRNCYSILRLMGPTQALLAPDTRGERRRDQVMSPQHYDQMLERCGKLPAGVRHLVVVLTVPIVYPKLPLSQPILSTIEGSALIKGAMTKTGVGAGIIDKFHHVELLDDIEDHWDSSTHMRERADFIQRFQAHAAAHQHRVTFLSGDVHCAQVGRLYTTPKMAHLQHDHRFMPQITSSAIWNNPPPDILIKLLSRLDRAHRVDQDTKEKTVKQFRGEDGKACKLLGRRNWCEVTEVIAARGGNPRSAGMLEFAIRAEDPAAKEAAPAVYTIPVPTYVPPATAAAKRRSYKGRALARLCAPPQGLNPLDEF